MNRSVGQEKIEEPGNSHDTADWNEQLNAYADGELGLSEIQRIEQHLEGCQDCRAEVAAIKKLTANLAQLPQMALPRAFTITPERARKLRPQPLYIASRVALAMAAALLIFVCALDFMGLVASPTSNVSGQAAITSAPTSAPDELTLPPIGTRVGCTPASSGSGVSCENDSQTIVTYTSSPITTRGTAVVGTSKSVSVTETSPSVRIAEIGLALLVLALAAFVLATRPRAPSKLRL